MGKGVKKKFCISDTLLRIVVFAVTIILLLPVLDVIGVLAGTLNYPIWKFFIATVLGRIMRNFIIAWSGAKIIS